VSTKTNSIAEGRFTVMVFTITDSSGIDPDMEGSVAEPSFVPDPAISAISAGLANMATSSGHSQLPTAGEQELPEPAVSSESEEYSPIMNGPQQDSTPSPAASTPSSVVESSMEHEEPLWNGVSGISLSSLDLENTLVAINGKQYSIPNAEVWLFPYEEDNITIPPGSLKPMVRPSFLSILRTLGPQSAMKAINGHRLFLWTSSASQASMEPAIPGSDAISNEQQLSAISSLTIVYPGSKTAGRLDEASNGPDDNLGDAAVGIATEITVPGGTEMDGTDSVERASVSTLRKQ
jgi:hypothetical protein